MTKKNLKQKQTLKKTRKTSTTETRKMKTSTMETSEEFQLQLEAEDPSFHADPSEVSEDEVPEADSMEAEAGR